MEPATRLRADAQRNRDLIISAAKTVFASRGPDVPMEEIAKESGVGVGTLYRRFPDRDALIRAVAADNLGQILDKVRAAMAEEPTGWDALARIMRLSTDLRLSVALTASSERSLEIIRGDEKITELRRTLMGALDEVVTLAQREKTVRQDVGGGDVAVLCSLLLQKVRSLSEEGLEFATERCVAIMLDGLRASASNPLPGRPLTKNDVKH
ncbi:TetR/AcrR family transcriptional regulator [Herbihabitans rhizosphaerae]|uniref:TetR/AcrR family transcriptional regulator n=1 Tax=Herbihabitans rhizosphaerae TaxID=1872711 RepID=UPI001F5FB331|nr:TetR/AcrR family transcriptional regulator [Herbihabitans rhizosphaerae]